MTESSSEVHVDALLKYHHDLRPHPTYKASISVKRTDPPKTITDLVTAPSSPSFIPSICSIYLSVNGERDPEIVLNPLKILTLSTYFEHVVSKQLTRMNFLAEHHGNNDPDIVAHHKTTPNEIFDVECSMQNTYDVDKFDKDYAKFRYESYKWRFTRLLLVPYSSEISSGVLERIAKHHQANIGLVRFRDLRKLVDGFENAEINDEQVLFKLMQRGEISVNSGSEIPLDLVTRRKIEIIYEVE